jgi:hypothetical protein
MNGLVALVVLVVGLVAMVGVRPAWVRRPAGMKATPRGWMRAERVDGVMRRMGYARGVRSRKRMRVKSVGNR